MARYFAQIDENNIVTNVVVIGDHEAWLTLNYAGTWVETYMDREDKNYAGIGYTYYPDKQNFAGPQLFPSWSLDENCNWVPPIAKPEIEDENTFYKWNELQRSWDKIIFT